MSNSTPKVSLSFTKTIGKRKLQSSALEPEKPEDKQVIKEAITCFDKNVKISEPPKPEDALVIPLVESRRESLYKNVKKDSLSNIPTEIEIKDKMSIDEQAAAALIEESTRKLEELKNNGSLQQQTISVMNGLSDMDGEMSTLENYDQVNVEHFGAALLRGMGWNKSKGVGKNNTRVVEIIDPTNKGDLTLSNKKKKTDKNDPDGEELELKKGSFVLIVEGRNKGSYGIVECLDEDHVLIRLAREEKVVRDVEQNIRVASAKEYKDCSRVINKAMYDDFKAAESNRSNEARKEKYSGNSSADFKKKEKEKDYRVKERSSKILEESKDLRRGIEKPEPNLKERDKLEKLKDKIQSSKNEKERFCEKDRKDYKRKIEEYKYKNVDEKEYKEKKKERNIDKSASNVVESKPEIPWANENLRVRIIDKVYKGGKYHKEKVVIQSVDTIDNCTCITDDGKVLYDVNPNHLETVIPKSSAVVLIVKGIYKGQKARILELHKEKEKASVQLIEERSVLLKLYYDDICEYVSR